MSSKSSTRQTLGIFSMILGSLVVIVSIWLLIVANNNDDCRDLGSHRSYSEPGRSKYDYGSGGRTREWFCENTISKWNTAAGISITFGFFQLCASVFFIWNSTGAKASTKPKLRTIYWIICNFIVLIGMFTSIMIVKSADIFNTYHTQPTLGWAYVGGLVIDAIGSILFPILAFCLILKMISDDVIETRSMEGERDRFDYL